MIGWLFWSRARARREWQLSLWRIEGRMWSACWSPRARQQRAIERMLRRMAEALRPFEAACVELSARMAVTVARSVPLSWMLARADAEVLLGERREQARLDWLARRQEWEV